MRMYTCTMYVYRIAMCAYEGSKYCELEDEGEMGYVMC